MKTQAAFFIGDREAASLGAALSIAQNRAMRADAEQSFYVRDSAGVALYRVDRERDGVVTTHKIEAAS